MAKLNREPTIIINYVTEFDADDHVAARRAVTELARALARIAAREDDAAEGGV